MKKRVAFKFDASTFSSIGFPIKMLLCICTLFQLNVLAQPLSGTYTIGGSAPDFVSFTSAVSSLNSNGVAGPVTFNVRAGIYNEHIKINNYPGASALNPVVFQAETGSAEDVILTHTHTSTTTNYNYTVYLNGAKHLTFQHLTIRAEKQTPTSSDKNRVLYITNHSDSVHFNNNHIISWETTSGSLDYNACILVGSDNLTGVQNDYISFTNNTITGGYTGLKIEADELNVSKAPLVANNIFENQGIYGIYLTWTQNPKIIDNDLSTSDVLANYIGMDINNTVDSLLVDGNFIDIRGGSTTGIVIRFSQNSSSDFRFVTNNMINIGPDLMPPNTPRGIRSLSNDTLIVAYNSVHIHQPTTNGMAFESDDNDNVLLQNNQLIHYGGGLCYKISDNTTTYFASNNNNLFNNSTTICTVESTSYSSTGALFLGEGTDEFSVQGDPYFLSDSVLISFNALSYETGLPIAGITTDFYNNLRSVVLPDIGCFEGTLSDSDAGIAGHNLLNVHPCAGDSLQVTVDIKNFGVSNLTSAEIFAGTSDSVYFSASWTGSLVQFDQENDFPIGYFVPAASDTIDFKIWCTSPNFSSDNMPMNDTVYVQTVTAMEGTYTIGTDSSDHFLTFTHAVNALVEAGVCGPVLIIADSGIYEEQFIIPAIVGASEINTITFQSENLDSSEVIIEYTAYNTTNNYVVQLKAANYITFKHISIRPLNGTYRYGLRLSYGASNNSFYNCWFTSPGTTGTAERALVFFDGWYGGSIDSNVFVNSRFENGGFQVYMDCEVDDPSTGNVFTGNYFTGSATICIRAVGQQDLLITNNIMVGSRSGYAGALGIIIDDCIGKFTIDKNKIHLTDIYPFHLIDIESYQSIPGVYGLITNNFVSSTAAVNASCLNISNASNIKLINNSFKNSGEPTALAEFSDVLDIHLYNNIFDAVNGTSCLFVSNTNINEIHSDYNVFYTTSGSDSLITYYYTATPLYHSFATWQTVSAGEDVHSIFTDPQFTSSSDLHINNASAINDMAILMPGALTDIDNEIRDASAPDPGADEFEIDSATYYDIELISILHPNNVQCLPNDSIFIRVANNSIFAIDSFIVEWSLFGVLNDSVNIIQNFMPADTQDVYVGTFHFMPMTAYELAFKIMLPNDHPDNYMDNNHAYIDFGFVETVTIEAYKDPCVTTTELYIPNFPVDTILWSTGSTSTNTEVTSPGVYSVSVFKNGCETTATYLLE